jgi:hypothetical protein
MKNTLLQPKCKLVRNWSCQSERDRGSGQLGPDGERIISNLLGCEALGVGDCAWNSHWDCCCAGVAVRSESHAGDGFGGGVGDIGNNGVAFISGHAVRELN